ncbi:MAG: endolytic transglycosylase MltG [Lachnospiraceae bacterium]|nr:endolytic transglycosylase MltG [Lachnospiraceae bacterium]
MKTKQVILAVLGTIFKVAATIVLVYFVYNASMMAYDYGYRVFTEPAMAKEGEGVDITVDITMGKSDRQIGQILEAKGLVRDGDLFYIQALLSEYSGQLLPGSYVLNTSMTAKEMMEIMATEPEETIVEE